MDQPKFEVPPEMRNFAEQSVEQAKKAFDSFIAAARHAAVTAETQAKTAQGSAKEVGDMAMRFAERNISASFDFAQNLVRAKDAQEVLRLQSEYVKQQIAALTEQAKDISQKAAKMTGQ